MSAVLERFREDAHLAAAFVVDAEGELIASSGAAELPVEALAETALAKLQAAEGAERHLEPAEFGVIFSSLSEIDVYASWLRTGVALGLCFSRRITSLGAVHHKLTAVRDQLASDPELA